MLLMVVFAYQLSDMHAGVSAREIKRGRFSRYEHLLVLHRIRGIKPASPPPPPPTGQGQDRTGQDRIGYGTARQDTYQHILTEVHALLGISERSTNRDGCKN